jgi:predicted molibdopterin-dependent oxidoreductase YjgC
MRIIDHPILGKEKKRKIITIIVDGKEIEAYEGEVIAAALVAAGKRYFRLTRRYEKPRGIFCAIGRCTDCVMNVNGIPNVRTCVTHVEDGMVIETQTGSGEWK